MRTLFLLLLLLLPASTAFAHPRKPSPTRHKAASSPAKRTGGRSGSERRSAGRTKPGRAVAAPTRQGRRGSTKERGGRSQRTATRGGRTRQKSRAAAPRARAEAAPEPVHEAPAAPLPPIEVHHDRKEHHSADPPDAVQNTGFTPALYSARGRLIMPAPMKGSHEILVHQNVMADADGLVRIQDDAALQDLLTLRDLVPLPTGSGLQVDERLPLNRRYCRPWTAQFLAALAHAHAARFHTNLQVNSAVRTVEFQQRLLRTNGNAAPAEGDTASPHLTGQAVDLAKKGLSMSEIAWMRGYLLPLEQEGKIDVEEEFQQSCFHISIYKRYAARGDMPRTSVATRQITTSLAAALP